MKEEDFEAISKAGPYGPYAAKIMREAIKLPTNDEKRRFTFDIGCLLLGFCFNETQMSKDDICYNFERLMGRLSKMIPAISMTVKEIPEPTTTLN